MITETMKAFRVFLYLHPVLQNILTVLTFGIIFLCIYAPIFFLLGRKSQRKSYPEDLERWKFYKKEAQNASEFMDDVGQARFYKKEAREYKEDKIFYNQILNSIIELASKRRR